MGIFNPDESFDKISEHIRILHEDKPKRDLEIVLNNVEKLRHKNDGMITIRFAILDKTVDFIPQYIHNKRDFITSRCFKNIYPFALRVPESVTSEFAAEHILQGIKNLQKLENSERFVIIESGKEHERIGYNDAICDALIHDIYGII